VRFDRAPHSGGSDADPAVGARPARALAEQSLGLPDRQGAGRLCAVHQRR